MERKPKVAITGATGMLGSHLVAELLRRGEVQPVVLVRDRGRLGCLQHTLDRFGMEARYGEILIEELSLSNPQALKAVFQGCEVVYHCAAAVAFDPKGDEEIININAEIAGQVARAALEAAVGLLVHVSSIATLGAPAEPTQPDGSPNLIREDHLLTTLKGSSNYSIGKFYAESRVQAVALMGLSAVIVNPAIIIGEGAWDRSSGQLIQLGAQGGAFYTQGVKGYVDVRDVVRAMLMLTEQKSAIGQRFILSAANLSFRQLFSSIALAAGKRAPRWRAAEGWLSLAAWADGIHARLHGQLPRLNASIREYALGKSYYDGSRISKAYGFEYTPIEQTLRRVTKAYLKEQKK